MENTFSLTDKALLNAQNTVLKMIVKNAPFKDIIMTTIHRLEELLPDLQFIVHVRNSNQIISRSTNCSLTFISDLEKLVKERKLIDEDWLIFNTEEDMNFLSFRSYNGCCYIPVKPSNYSQQGTIILLLQNHNSLTPYEEDIIQHFIGFISLAFERKQETFFKEVYQLVENNISDLINIIDLQGSILFASVSHEQILGYEQDELLGKRARNFLHPKDQEWIDHYLEELKNCQSTLITECRLLKKDGTPIIVESKGVLVTDENEALDKIVIVSRDITARKEAEATIKYMAYHDSLTGIPNRRKLKEKLDRLLVESKRNQTSFSLLFIDLDNFKMINDEYGHEMGDIVLIKITERLKDSLHSDCFLARWGGDEFAVIIRNSNEDCPKTIAGNLLEEMSRPFEVDGLIFNITPSIGISTYPMDGEDLNTLFEKADKAMYRAKDNGKNNAITYHI